jgi:hypothetical protein
MTINTADYLALDDEEFDINEATAHLRDMRQELAYHIEVNKVLNKLESRIKSHMKAYGEVPDVEGVEAKISPVKDRLVVKNGMLPMLYAYLQGLGVEQDKLDEYFEIKSPPPSIRLKVA